MIGQPAGWLLGSTLGPERWPLLVRIDRARFASQTGADPVAALGERIAPLQSAGYLEADASHLRATPAGRQRLNAVLERLIA